MMTIRAFFVVLGWSNGQVGFDSQFLTKLANIAATHGNSKNQSISSCVSSVRSSVELCFYSIVAQRSVCKQTIFADSCSSSRLCAVRR